jgi:indolepyruvate decarboxylase
MASVADFLIERLENSGIRHIFGVPGDYILNFFGKLCESKKIELVNNADEEGAGFAADGYARLNGIGCVAVTYNVGALKVCNPIAGAFAERSPVVVISGAPGVSERGDAPLHHVVGSFDCQRQVFKNITCAQAVLDNPTTAGYEIDRVFEALRYYKQPVYIELPRDVSTKPIQYDVYTQGTPKGPETDFQNLEDALREVATWIEDAKNPVILAGVEIARYGHGRELVKFAERHNIPLAVTLLGKSVINEMHPLYIGVYAGSNSSQAYVKDMVEQSDCLLVLGEVITEATVGYRPSKAFQKRDMVICTVNELKVRNHLYPHVSFTDFCHTLFKTELTKRPQPVMPPKQELAHFVAKEATSLTTVRLFEQVNSMLDESMVVIADAGDSLLGALDLTAVHAHDTFLGPAFYLSMGFAIPVALGAKLAKPKMRPIVIVGDGAFQMSLSEISTMMQWKLNPIIFVLNNQGYTTERMILDGKFNDIRDWNYHQVTQLMGGGEGVKVTNETELSNAVRTALRSDKLYVINCIVQPRDVSPALGRIGYALAKKIGR